MLLISVYACGRSLSLNLSWIETSFLAACSDSFAAFSASFLASFSAAFAAFSLAFSAAFAAFSLSRSSSVLPLFRPVVAAGASAGLPAACCAAF